MVNKRPGRPARPTDSKDRILRAAQARFAEHGYARTSLRSIARDADVDYGCQLDGPIDELPLHVATAIYRICQEAILNACKYSGSEKVIVRLEDSAGWLHVSVIDHGCGFDTEQPEIKGSGCGLVGMQERASVIGARLAMESDEHGTKMTLVAPMHVAEGKEAGA